MSAENELNEYIAKLGLSVEMRNALMAKIIGYYKEQRQETASAVETIVMWRSPKEELPKDKGLYYVAIALQGKKDDPSIEPATYMGGGKWRTYGLGEVLFWMEIPELPQAT